MTQSPDHPITPSPVLRVAIWCAVSSKAQATDDKASLPEQEAAGRRFAESLDAVVTHVYTVPGHSRDLIFWRQAEATMPAYRQLRQDCESHAFDVLHAVDIDRLGRDPALAQQVVSLVQKSGAELYLASAPHPIGHSSTGLRYLHAIQAVRAGEEQTIRVRRHHFGMNGRTRRGLHPSNWPTGYRPVRDPATGRNIGAQPHPDEAPAIRLITDLYLRGDPLHAIRRQLDASPYRPRSAPAWSCRTISDIIHNDTYAGFITWGETAMTDPSDRFPALWDPGTHRAILRERRRRNDRAHRSQRHPLSGFVYCARCGGPMTAQNGAIPAFRCGRHTRRTLTGVSCHPNRVHQTDLIAALQAHLTQLARRPDPIPWPDDRPQITSELQQLRTRARDTQKQRERLALALAAGHIEPAIYRTTDDGLLAKLDQLQHQITTLQREIDAAPDPAEIRQTLTALLAIPLAQLLQTLPPPRVRQLLSLLNLRIGCDTGRILSITP